MSCLTPLDIADLLIETTMEGLSLGDGFPLLKLPPEILLVICDFLEPDLIINVLSQVCRYLCDLSEDNLIWRTRLQRRWPYKRYPPIKREWAACLNERVDDTWSAVTIMCFI